MSAAAAAAPPSDTKVPIAADKGKSNQISEKMKCHYFARGHCKLGAQCKYVHIVQTEAETGATCSTYYSGHRARGASGAAARGGSGSARGRGGRGGARGRGTTIVQKVNGGARKVAGPRFCRTCENTGQVVTEKNRLFDEEGPCPDCNGGTERPASESAD